MREYLGRVLIESAAPPLVQVIADVEAEELLLIDADLIAANWDPYRVQTKNLIYLAFALGVQLWDDEWSEETKRAWLAMQWQFKALRGTETAFRIALGLWGYTLEDVLTPPQGFYASAEMSEAERSEWIERMPQIRISTQRTKGYGDPGEWFAGDGFAGEAVAGLDDGPFLYGRRGVIRRNGVDTPLRSQIIERTSTAFTTETVEQIQVPGLCTMGFIAGVDFAGEDKFVGAAELEAEIVTVRNSSTADRVDYELVDRSVEPGLTPIDVRSKRVSDVGDGGPFFYAGDFAGDGIAADDNADEMLADVIYLLDPDIAVPMTEGVSFAGVDRVGLEAKTAEMLVDLHTVAPPFAWYADETFVGEGCAIADDPTPRENALRAIGAAKALRDTILVSFAPRRRLTFGDTIRPQTKAGTWVATLL